MVEYEIIYSKQAEKDKKLLKQAELEEKTLSLLVMISSNPYQSPQFYENLRGNMTGCISRRISLQHRLVHEVDEEKKEIFIIRMWSHYEKL